MNGVGYRETSSEYKQQQQQKRSEAMRSMRDFDVRIIVSTDLV